MTKAPKKRGRPYGKGKAAQDQMISFYETVRFPDGEEHRNLVRGVVVRIDRVGASYQRYGWLAYRTIRVRGQKHPFPYGRVITLNSLKIHKVYDVYLPQVGRKYRANQKMVPEDYTEWQARGCVCNCCVHIAGNVSDE